jgi:hypothetical protein
MNSATKFEIQCDPIHRHESTVHFEWNRLILYNDSNYQSLKTKLFITMKKCIIFTPSHIYIIPR